MANTAVSSSLLSLLLVTHFVTSVTPIADIDRKSHKTELESSHDYSTNHFKSNHTTSYIWHRGWTHTHTHTNTHILWWHKSDFKKPGVRWPQKTQSNSFLVQ